MLSRLLMEKKMKFKSEVLSALIVAQTAIKNLVRIAQDERDTDALDVSITALKMLESLTNDD